jgi:hypothetical protein
LMTTEGHFFQYIADLQRWRVPFGTSSIVPHRYLLQLNAFQKNDRLRFHSSVCPNHATVSQCFNVAKVAQSKNVPLIVPHSIEGRSTVSFFVI